MVKQLLRQIILICIFMALGIANWITAPACSALWAQILGTISAILCFILVWRIYRTARQIVEIIDLDLDILKMRIDNLALRLLLSPREQKTNSEPSAPAEDDHNHGVHPV